MSGNPKTDGDVSEPGLPALIKRLNRFWRSDKYTPKADCDVLDDPREFLTALAIPLDKAYELWGFDRVVADERPVSVDAVDVAKPRTRGAAWSDYDLAKLLQDFEAAPGKTQKAKQEVLSIARGVSTHNIRKYVIEARKKAKEKADAERASKFFPGATPDKR